MLSILQGMENYLIYCIVLQPTVEVYGFEAAVYLQKVQQVQEQNAPVTYVSSLSPTSLLDPLGQLINCS